MKIMNVNIMNKFLKITLFLLLNTCKMATIETVDNEITQLQVEIE